MDMTKTSSNMNNAGFPLYLKYIIRTLVECIYLDISDGLLVFRTVDEKGQLTNLSISKENSRLIIILQFLNSTRGISEWTYVYNV